MKIISTLLFTILQTNVQGAMDSFISKTVVPVAIGIIIISILIGGGLNLSKIIDADGSGTRRDGIINMVWIVGGVTIFCVIVGGTISLLKSQLGGL